MKRGGHVNFEGNRCTAGWWRQCGLPKPEPTTKEYKDIEPPPYTENEKKGSEDDDLNGKKGSGKG